MAAYKLTYFHGKGRGEMIRLLFVLADQDFEDDRIPREEWPKFKPSFPLLKQVPVLTISDNGKQIVYCQSGAIAKYLAKKFGFFGFNAEEGLLVDEVYDSAQDLLMDMRKAILATSEQDKADANKKLTDETVPKFVEYVKKRSAEFGQNGYVIGSKLTLADLAVYNAVDITKTRGFSTLWNKYPEITQHTALVESNEKIAAHVAKRPVTAF